MLLGCGNVGGIMRNNGRFTAAEENIAWGTKDSADAQENDCLLYTSMENTLELIKGYIGL